jgi:tetratricopeptide (TPR) repeat protein
MAGERVKLEEVINHAKQLMEGGQPDQAILLCRHVFRYYPRCLEATRVLGEAYTEKRLLEEADKLFTYVLAADPHDVLGYVDRGFIAYERGEQENAIIYYERALELDPNIEQLRLELLRLYREVKNDLRPRLRMTKAGLAHQRMRDGLYQPAIEEFQAILRETPGRLDIQVGLAEAYWRNKDYYRSEQLCLELLKEHQYLIKCNLILWHMYGVRRRESRAADYLEKAQALDPMHLVAERLFEDSMSTDGALNYIAMLGAAALPPPNFEKLEAESVTAPLLPAWVTADAKTDLELGLKGVNPEDEELSSLKEVGGDSDWLQKLLEESEGEISAISQETPEEQQAEALAQLDKLRHGDEELELDNFFEEVQAQSLEPAPFELVSEQAPKADFDLESLNFEPSNIITDNSSLEQFDPNKLQAAEEPSFEFGQFDPGKMDFSVPVEGFELEQYDSSITGNEDESEDIEPFAPEKAESAMPFGLLDDMPTMPGLSKPEQPEVPEEDLFESFFEEEALAGITPELTSPVEKLPVDEIESPEPFSLEKSPEEIPEPFSLDLMEEVSPEPFSFEPQKLEAQESISQESPAENPLESFFLESTEPEIQEPFSLENPAGEAVAPGSFDTPGNEALESFALGFEEDQTLKPFVPGSKAALSPEPPVSETVPPEPLTIGSQNEESLDPFSFEFQQEVSSMPFTLESLKEETQSPHFEYQVGESMKPFSLESSGENPLESFFQETPELVSLDAFPPLTGETKAPFVPNLQSAETPGSYTPPADNLLPPFSFETPDEELPESFKPALPGEENTPQPDLPSLEVAPDFDFNPIDEQEQQNQPPTLQPAAPAPVSHVSDDEHFLESLLSEDEFFVETLEEEHVPETQPPVLEIAPAATVPVTPVDHAFYMRDERGPIPDFVLQSAAETADAGAPELIEEEVALSASPADKELDMPIRRGRAEDENFLFDWENEDLPDYLIPFAMDEDEAAQYGATAPNPPISEVSTSPARVRPRDDTGGGDLPDWLNPSAKQTPPVSRSGGFDMGAIPSSDLPNWVDRSFEAPSAPPPAFSMPGGNFGMDDLKPFTPDQGDMFGGPVVSPPPPPSNRVTQPMPAVDRGMQPFNPMEMAFSEPSPVSGDDELRPFSFDDITGEPGSSFTPPPTPPVSRPVMPPPPAAPQNVAPFSFGEDMGDLQPFNPFDEPGSAPAAPPPIPRFTPEPSKQPPAPAPRSPFGIPGNTGSTGPAAFSSAFEDLDDIKPFSLDENKPSPTMPSLPGMPEGFGTPPGQQGFQDMGGMKLSDLTGFGSKEEFKATPTSPTPPQPGFKGPDIMSDDLEGFDLEPFSLDSFGEIPGLGKPNDPLRPDNAIYAAEPFMPSPVRKPREPEPEINFEPGQERPLRRFSWLNNRDKKQETAAEDRDKGASIFERLSAKRKGQESEETSEPLPTLSEEPAEVDLLGFDSYQSFEEIERLAATGTANVEKTESLISYPAPEESGLGLELGIESESFDFSLEESLSPGALGNTEELKAAFVRGETEDHDAQEAFDLGQLEPFDFGEFVVPGEKAEKLEELQPPMPDTSPLDTFKFDLGEAFTETPSTGLTAKPEELPPFDLFEGKETEAFKFELEEKPDYLGEPDFAQMDDLFTFEEPGEVAPTLEEMPAFEVPDEDKLFVQETVSPQPERQQFNFFEPEMEEEEKITGFTLPGDFGTVTPEELMFKVPVDEPAPLSEDFALLEPELDFFKEEEPFSLPEELKEEAEQAEITSFDFFKPETAPSQPSPTKTMSFEEAARQFGITLPGEELVAPVFEEQPTLAPGVKEASPAEELEDFDLGGELFPEYESDLTDFEPAEEAAPFIPVEIAPLVEEPAPVIEAVPVPEYTAPEPVAKHVVEEAVSPLAEPAVAATDDFSVYLNRVTANPRDLDANLELGNAYYRQKEYQQALNYFATSVKLADKNGLDAIVTRLQDMSDIGQSVPRYHRVLGDAYMKQGKNSWAISEYSKALGAKK